MDKADATVFSPNFKNYRNKRNDKRSNSLTSRDSSEHMLEDDDDQASPQITTEKDSDILGNSLAGMSKAEISKHHELCMRLAAENKITLKNSFGLHLISIMNQMVKECPDLQVASLSLAASSKIYCGRVEALYKDTFQFHSNLQTMVATGKKGRKDGVESNSEEDPNEKKRSRENKSKSYLTSHESVSMDLQESDNKMPHSNFVVINSAFSASRSAVKLVSLPLESDSNKISFSSYVCFRPKQPISSVPYDAHKKLTGFFEKIYNLNFKSIEDMESSTCVLFQPEKSFSPKPDFEAPMYDNFSPVREEHCEVDDMIDRFSILNITVDAFTHDLFGAVTGGNTVDARGLPPGSALKTVLKNIKSTVKKKKEVKPKELFFSGTLDVQKHLFQRDRKTSNQAPISEWSLNQTSVFHSTDDFINSLANNSNNDSSDKQNDLIKELQGVQLPFRFASDSETRQNFRACYLKCPEVWKRHHLKISQNLKVRPSSLGMVLGGRSNEPSFDNLAQSFRELSIHESLSGNAVDFDANDSSPLPDEEVGFASNDGHLSPLDLPEKGNSELLGEEHVSDIADACILETDVKSMMVTPPELVKVTNVRFEVVPNSINMEKAKDFLWSVISAHLNEKDSTLLSKVHEELEIMMKSTPTANKQSLFDGINLQFTFVILLILANEKVLLLENIKNSTDIVIRKDVSEIDSSEAY